jgi:hypothetical protein
MGERNEDCLLNCSGFIDKKNTLHQKQTDFLDIKVSRYFGKRFRADFNSEKWYLCHLKSGLYWPLVIRRKCPETHTHTNAANVKNVFM